MTESVRRRRREAAAEGAESPTREGPARSAGAFASAVVRERDAKEESPKTFTRSSILP